jgi:molecular chaperone DnaK (HSP70)
MDGWALDLGTTNTGIARWDDDLGRPRLVELPAVCRSRSDGEPFEAPRLVPSAVDLIDRPGLLDRIGRWPPLERRAFLGRQALIGRPALDRNYGVAHASFVPTFKPALATEALRPLARAGPHAVTAREAARAFLRELLAEVKRATGRRPRDLVVTSPVTAFETYRAEVQGILRRLGVDRVRFVDEPVAAALGYGLSLTEDRTSLVVDIGGGTMHVVLVRLSPKGILGGQATVLAKRGREMGGNAVDGWVLGDLCRELGHPLEQASADEGLRLWRRIMLAEACRVKEAVFFEESSEFLFTPPGAERAMRGRPGSGFLPFTRARLSQVLEANGFLRALNISIDEVFEQARVLPSAIDDVLLVGGSTLLPGVFPLLEERFERRRIRAWQPFEAVAYGAACFAADRMAARDFIVHDYAFVTHDPATGAAQQTVVVPRGTRFPTPPPSGSDSSSPPVRSAWRRRRSSSSSVKSRAATSTIAASCGTRPAICTSWAARPAKPRSWCPSTRRPDPRLSRSAPFAARPPPAAGDRLRRERRTLAGRDRARPPHPARAHERRAGGAAAVRPR